MKRISLLLAIIVLATMLGCESPEDKPTASGDPEVPQDLSAEDAIENLVRRTYQYLAMYNVINKAAMMEGNPMRTGWNGTFANTALTDHTAKGIARPNNDTLYIPTVMDLRNDAVVVSYPAFDSKFVCLETSARNRCSIPNIIEQEIKRWDDEKYRG